MSLQFVLQLELYSSFFGFSFYLFECDMCGMSLQVKKNQQNQRTGVSEDGDLGEESSCIEQQDSGRG